jgi:diguanylate cyclase (GGDEF)-like protein
MERRTEQSPPPSGEVHPPHPLAKPAGRKSSELFTNPLPVFLITLLAIFLGEAAVMFLLRLLPPLTTAQEALVDALMLVCIVFPALFLLILKPMRLHVAERRRVEEKLRALSITDELTGLLNRRGFFVLAEQQLRIADRHTKNMVLVYADLDNLKEINDSAGHQAGDRVLAETAAFLKANFRRSDIMARMGGDEFVVLQVEDSDAEALRTRFQEAFDREVGARYREYGLSISIGSATYEPHRPHSLDDLLAAADTAMYGNKCRKAGQPS